MLILLMSLFLTLWFFLCHKVWVFSDWSVHLNIINYIEQNKTIPKDDFAWQINVSFMQPRSFVVPMIYPPNIYVFFAYSAEIIGTGSVFTYDFISIVLILFSWILLYYIVKMLLPQKKIAMISIFIFFLLPFWYRSLVHRIVEPISMLSSFLLLYLVLKSKRKDILSSILIWFFLFLIYYIKPSNLYFVAIILFVLLMQKKSIKFIMISIISSLILWLPAILYSINIFWSISPVPPWIPIIDSTIFNPRWNNQSIADWERDLNIKVDNIKIKELTMKQFTEDVQISNMIYIRNWQIGKVIQNYIPLQIQERWSQWYHIPLWEAIASLNFFLFFFWLIFIFINYKKNNKYFFFFVISLIVVSLFSLKFTVFRYYINSIILNLIAFACWIYFLYRKLSNNVFLTLMCGFVIFSIITLRIEVLKDLSYQNSIWHRLTNNSWWLLELQSLSKENDTLINEWDIFTPVLEAAYYLHKKIYWDQHTDWSFKPGLSKIFLSKGWKRHFFLSEKCKYSVYFKSILFKQSCMEELEILWLNPIG